MSVWLEDMLADITSLDLPAFKDLRGEAFLVRSTSDGDLELESSELRTSPGQRGPTDLILRIPFAAC